MGVLASPVLPLTHPKGWRRNTLYLGNKGLERHPLLLGWARSAVLSVLLGVFFELLVFRGIFISLRDLLRREKKKKKKKRKEDKLFFGCVVIEFLYGALAAHGNVLVFAVSSSRSSRLAVSAFGSFVSI